MQSLLHYTQAPSSACECHMNKLNYAPSGHRIWPISSLKTDDSRSDIDPSSSSRDFGVPRKPFGPECSGGANLGEVDGDVVVEGVSSDASSLSSSLTAGVCFEDMEPVTASKMFGAIGVMRVMWLEVRDS